MDIFKLGEHTKTPNDSFSLAKTLGLISLTPPKCQKCSSTMKAERGKTRHGINGIWRCPVKACRVKESIFKNTIFFGMHATLSQILRLTYCWSTRIPVSTAFQFCGVEEKTAINWFKIFRKTILAYNASLNIEKIGGPGLTVEIDESHLIKRKYNVGRIPVSNAVWVVGGICRETGAVFLKTVRQRNRETLEELILEHVILGTKIITDCWRGYVNLNNLGFIHVTVNHSLNFVDPSDRTVHTQTIERVWRSLKSTIPVGCKNCKIDEYIGSFVFVNQFNVKNILGRFEYVCQVLAAVFR